MPPTRTDTRGITETEQVLRAGFLDISAIAPRIQGSRGADRGFVAGRSGSGKSFLSERILTAYNVTEDWRRDFRAPVLIVDVNDTFGFPVQKTYTRVEQIKINPNYRAIKYVPDVDQLGAEPWNEFWSICFFHKGPLLVYVDETRAMEPIFNKNFEKGNYMTAYLTRGRARSKGAILGAQRPVFIPKDIIGQAEWFYVFDLPLEDDRITMAGVIGRQSEDGEDIRDRRSLGRYEFWFKNPDTFNPVKAIIV